MPSLPSTRTDCVARQILLHGQVQGQGVRPVVYRLAERHSLQGYVRNTCAGVEVVVQGSSDAVESFCAALPAALPPGAALQQCAVKHIPVSKRAAFTILDDSDAGPVATLVPRDLGLCDECLAEVLSATDRRHHYAFTSCTRCGPRYSLLRAMPYDRAATSMAVFPLCGACVQEYGSSRDRRFHAEGIACPQCGPQVWATNAQRRVVGYGEKAIQFAVDLLRSGEILALKGIGGYQLLCDATSQEAVLRLRRRKCRAAKPLAVMVSTLESAGDVAVVGNVERDALASHSNPIVLVRSCAGSALCDALAPGLDEVGIMLPSTPLHELIARGVSRPLVCTSGNVEGEPLVYRESEAEALLSELCDGWLHHDREIVRPIDDSVVRVIARRSVTIRLARGLAPLALSPSADRPMLALGGHLKAAPAWYNGRQAVLGPHVGDLETLATRERLMMQLDDWQRFYRFEPELLVHDLHPDYFSTRWAESQEVPRLAVQHHHAHVVASMLEHQWLDRTVLGVAWDGIGYGTDGTLWGGEFLLCHARGFSRLARLRPFALPGDRCVQEPVRTAMSVLAATLGVEATASWLSATANLEHLKPLLRILNNASAAPRTSSAGRLFDAVAYLCLGIERVDYEGQAGMQLEAIADRSAAGSYRLPLLETVCNGEPLLELDWRPLVDDLLRDQRGGATPGDLSMRFHRTLAAGIAQICRLRPESPVVLCGGVFHNRLLTECVVEQFEQYPQPLGLPGTIPIGDGGIAAGQLAIASATREYKRCV